MTALLQLQLCPDCGRAILPVLDKPATDEDLFLQGIAKKLQRCEVCFNQGVKLLMYVRREQRQPGWWAASHT